jgi:hypothetical protein
LIRGCYVRIYIFNIFNIELTPPPLVIYASKRRLATSVMLHVVEALDSADAVRSPTGTGTGARFFRPFGEVRNLSNHHLFLDRLTFLMRCV